MIKENISLDKIKCPNCGESIAVNETLYRQITEKARADLKVEVVEQQKALTEREKEIVAKERSIDKAVEEKVKIERARLEKDAQKKAQENVAVELEDLKRQATEKDGKLAVLQKAELEFRAQKRQLEDKEKALDLEFQKKLDTETKKIKAAAIKEAQSAQSLELNDLRQQVDKKDKKLKEAEKAELELRQKTRELEEKEKTLELETARKIASERAKIQEATAKQLQEEHRLNDAEKDKKLQDALKMNDELKRKLQQGSQQTQGEVLELELEANIKSSFPSDSIEPIPKGVNGADVIQRVFHRNGNSCGTIIWESKRTKSWVADWIQKLKDDQRLVKAEVAILVSEALPKEVKNFALVNGVWVTNPQCALGVASALRIQLIEVATTKLAAVGKNEKMEILYSYLSGPEFKQRMEAIVEAFVSMQKDLLDERRAAERQWAKREKQIQKVISNTSGMYGDFQGLIGSSLQTIPALMAGDMEEDDIREGKKSEALTKKQDVVVNSVDDLEEINPESIPF